MTKPRSAQVKALAFSRASLAEFLSVTFFQFICSSVEGGRSAWANGLALAAAVYLSASVSGGHVNPAVSLAAGISGHVHWLGAIVYMIVQVAGGIVGSLLVVALNKDVTIGEGTKGPGCLNPAEGPALTVAWEMVLTSILIMVIFSTCFARSNQGPAGPAAIGIITVVLGLAGGAHTFAVMNPARSLGAAIVMNCYWHQAWFMVLGQMLGGVIAGVLSAALHGIGPHLPDLLGQAFVPEATEEQPEEGTSGEAQA